MVVDEVLPDGHGIATASERLDNQFSIRLARARIRREAWAASHAIRDCCGKAVSRSAPVCTCVA